MTEGLRNKKEELSTALALLLGLLLRADSQILAHCDLILTLFTNSIKATEPGLTWIKICVIYINPHSVSMCSVKRDKFKILMAITFVNFLSHNKKLEI